MQNIINSKLEVLALTIYALRIGGFSGSIGVFINAMAHPFTLCYFIDLDTHVDTYIYVY